MSRVFYNGIELAMCSVQCHREPCWDGPSYLYTRWVLKVRGVLNPAATSWAIQDGLLINIPADGRGNTGQAYDAGRTALASPTAVPLGPGTVGAKTDVAIRNALAQPRKLLVWTVGGFVILVSPAICPDKTGGALYQVDAKNGPTPLGEPIVYISGVKTIIVEFSIETHLNERDLFTTTSQLSALLSHRWEMQHAVDQDAFCTRTIRGRAIFRTDRLAQLSANPDDYRSWLFHPCPPNFKRDRQEVVPSQDGTSYSYVLVDRETSFNIICGNSVSRIEASFSSGLFTPKSSDEASVEAVGPAIDFATGFVRFLAGDWGGGAAAMSSGASGIATVAAASVPRMTHEWDVRVWGTRDSTRSILAGVAAKIIKSRVNWVALAFSRFKFLLSQDAMGKFVRLQASAQTGPLLGVTAFIGELFGAGTPLTGLFDAGPDELDEVTSSTRNPTSTLPNDPIIAAGSYAQGARGTYVAEAIAQALSASSPPPVQPLDPPPFTPRTP